MKIREVRENKKQYLPLLLLADEQEDMVDCYLERGKMYVLEDDGVKSECVVTDEGDGILEIKNLATVPKFQGKGYGKELILFLEKEYSADFSVLQVGTGESDLTVPFYEKCGFTYSHRIKDFFTEHYDHPIYENGIQLKDMIYMRKPFYQIRKFRDTDLEEVMQIWLSGNLQAHSFMEAAYWEKNYEAVKAMLPHAEIYVCVDKSTEQIVGFIGLSDHSEEDYIEGIFVRDAARSKGIGKRILDYVKNRQKNLTLSVYQKNRRAVQFYMREGFEIESEQVESAAKEKEYRMMWKAR